MIGRLAILHNYRTSKMENSDRNNSANLVRGQVLAQGGDQLRTISDAPSTSTQDLASTPPSQPSTLEQEEEDDIIMSLPSEPFVASSQAPPNASSPLRPNTAIAEGLNITPLNLKEALQKPALIETMTLSQLLSKPALIESVIQLYPQFRVREMVQPHRTLATTPHSQKVRARSIIAMPILEELQPAYVAAVNDAKILKSENNDLEGENEALKARNAELQEGLNVAWRYKNETERAKQKAEKIVENYEQQLTEYFEGNRKLKERLEALNGELVGERASCETARKINSQLIEQIKGLSDRSEILSARKERLEMEVEGLRNAMKEFENECQECELKKAIREEEVAVLKGELEKAMSWLSVSHQQAMELENDLWEKDRRAEEQGIRHEAVREKTLEDELLGLEEGEDEIEETQTPIQYRQVAMRSENLPASFMTHKSTQAAEVLGQAVPCIHTPSDRNSPASISSDANYSLEHGDSEHPYENWVPPTQYPVTKPPTPRGSDSEEDPSPIDPEEQRLWQLQFGRIKYQSNMPWASRSQSLYHDSDLEVKEPSNSGNQSPIRPHINSAKPISFDKSNNVNLLAKGFETENDCRKANHESGASTVSKPVHIPKGPVASIAANSTQQCNARDQQMNRNGSTSSPTNMGKSGITIDYQFPSPLSSPRRTIDWEETISPKDTRFSSTTKPPSSLSSSSLNNSSSSSRHSSHLDGGSNGCKNSSTQTDSSRAADVGAQSSSSMKKQKTMSNSATQTQRGEVVDRGTLSNLVEKLAIGKKGPQSPTCPSEASSQSLFDKLETLAPSSPTKSISRESYANSSTQTNVNEIGIITSPSTSELSITSPQAGLGGPEAGGLSTNSSTSSHLSSDPRNGRRASNTGTAVANPSEYQGSVAGSGLIWQRKTLNVKWETTREWTPWKWFYILWLIIFSYLALQVHNEKKLWRESNGVKRQEVVSWRNDRWRSELVVRIGYVVERALAIDRGALG
jgi:hypothetical protein